MGEPPCALAHGTHHALASLGRAGVRAHHAIDVIDRVATSFTFRTDRARRELGFRPLVSREQGLAECLPYCRELLAEKQRSH